MSQAATAKRVTPPASIANDAGEPQAANSEFAPAGAGQVGFEAVQSAWRRNLEANAEAVRVFQAESAQLVDRLFDLNLQAVRSFATPAAPFELGASALELYMGYLGRCTALSQQAIVLPWTRGGR